MAALGLKEMGIFLWQGKEKDLPCWLSQFSKTNIYTKQLQSQRYVEHNLPFSNFSVNSGSFVYDIDLGLGSREWTPTKEELMVIRYHSYIT